MGEKIVVRARRAWSDLHRRGLLAHCPGMFWWCLADNIAHSVLRVPLDQDLCFDWESLTMTTSRVRPILKRYARLSSHGRPIRCTPSAKELRLGGIARREKVGTDGKLIYDSRDLARAAAEHLARETGYLMREYQCGRSRSGHFHLTTDRSAMRRARKAA